MKIEENINLAPFTTFKVGGAANFFVRLQNIEDIEEITSLAKTKKIPVFVLGGGSNIIISDEVVNFLVVKNEILGKEIIEENDNRVLISVGAGEEWDKFVEFCVDKNFSGIEALSAIPGTVGGAPIQNIGAYGTEVKEAIESVKIYDVKEGCFKIFSKEECFFSYRDSIFKKEPGRYIVLFVNFNLSKKGVIKIPDYPGVRESIKSEKPTVREIRELIKNIRANKLPDPRIIPNVGSFFKNPIISKENFNQIKEKFPDIKFFVMDDDRVKIPAGWLVEAVGLKGADFGSVGTYKNNALVLVNNGGANFDNVLNAEEKIKLAVKDKFGIELEREPIVVK